MKRYNDSLEKICFTDEEQDILIQRLATVSAMGNTRPVRHFSVRRTMVALVAAALCLSFCVAAADIVFPILRQYFGDSTPSAQSQLESAVLPLNLSQTHDGITVVLTECVGDDRSLYFGGRLTLPEAVRKGHALYFDIFGIDFGDEYKNAKNTSGVKIDYEHPNADGSYSFTYYITLAKSVKGAQADLYFGGLSELWRTTEDARTNKPISGARWSFENVGLDYPNVSLNLTPNVTVGKDGLEAQLTSLTISPLSVSLTLEGDFGERAEELERLPIILSFQDGSTISADQGKSGDGGSTSVTKVVMNRHARQLIDLNALESISVDGILVEINKDYVSN